MDIRQQIYEIYDKHKKNVQVHCDEYHNHRAISGCLSGPKASIDVCKMHEYICILESRIEFAKSLFDKNIE